jgi:hypothetical protein
VWLEANERSMEDVDDVVECVCAYGWEWEWASDSVRIRTGARTRNRMRNHVGNKEQRMVSSVLDPSIAFPPFPPSPVLDLQLANRAPHRASG